MAKRTAARIGSISRVSSAFTISGLLTPGVRLLLSSLTCAFASGAVGGVVRFALAALVHLMVEGKALAQWPSLDASLPALYQNVVIGGLWGFIFIFRVGNLRHLGLQAVVYGLIPTAVHLCLATRTWGLAGLELSPLVPAIEMLLNTAGWSLAGLSWFSMLSYDEDLDASDAALARANSIFSTSGSSALTNPLLV